MNPAHKALRDATAQAHDRVDSAFAAFDLTDRDSYAAFLAAHAAALLPLEAALDAAGAERVISDWPQRRRGALLIADLAALEADVPAPVEYRPVLDDDAAIAGALYVVEGSRLGGRMLARGIGANLPRGYLDSGQPTENWRNLLARIESLLYDDASKMRAIDAAIDVFAAFETAGRDRLTKV